MFRASANEQADRVLGGRDDVRLGRVRDHDPAARRRIHVDVVDADARAPDHLQIRPRVDQVGGELGRGADDDPVVGADDRREVALGVDVDVELLAQQVDAGFGDLLADQNFRAFAHRSNRSRNQTGPRVALLQNGVHTAFNEDS